MEQNGKEDTLTKSVRKVPKQRFNDERSWYIAYIAYSSNKEVEKNLNQRSFMKDICWIDEALTTRWNILSLSKLFRIELKYLEFNKMRKVRNFSKEHKNDGMCANEKNIGNHYLKIL